MNAERCTAIKISGVTVTWGVANFSQLSFDGVSSMSFLLSDHLFHLYMRRYELSIAVYLCRDDPIPNAMPILCRLWMIDHIGQEKLIGEKEVVIENDKEFVLLESVMMDDIERQKEEFLSKDTFTISCSLSSSYRLNLLRQQELESTQHVINRFETLSSDLENFYKSRQNTDALLKAESTEFPVHRAILSARSPELASMLNSESPDRAVTISNLLASVLQDVLYYVYTGKIRASALGNVVQMLAAANRFSLHELKGVCLKLLRSGLSEDTVFDAAVLAFEYGDLLLKEEVERYLAENIVTILPTQRWKDFCSERYAFANEILIAVLLRMHVDSANKEPEAACNNLLKKQ